VQTSSESDFFICISIIESYSLTLFVITCLNAYCVACLEDCLILLTKCHVKNYFYSSLLSLLVSVFCVVFPFCNDHQILGVSRYRNPWWSQWWWKCGNVVRMVGSGSIEHLLGHSCLGNLLLYEQAFWTTVKLLNFVLFMASWCALVFLSKYIYG